MSVRRDVAEFPRTAPATLGVLIWLLFVAVSCHRPPEAVEAPLPGLGATAGGPLLSPAGTVREVRRHLAEDRLTEVERFLLPGQRGEVMALLRAVRGVAGSNESLQSAVRERMGRAAARRVDRSQVVNAVGVFSRDVAVIDERTDNGTAVVTIQVAGRLPLEPVRLVRTPPGWLIQTDAPVAGLADELRALGKVLQDLARMVQDTEMTVEELERELRVREAAVGRRIATLLASPPSPRPKSPGQSGLWSAPCGFASGSGISPIKWHWALPCRQAICCHAGCTGDPY